MGVLAAVAACAAAPRGAPETGRAPAARPASGTRAPQEAAEAERPNSIGLFLGNTHTSGENDASIGVKYERRLKQSTGVGVILEFTPTSRERLVTAPSLFLHPYRGLSLMVSPGVQVEDSETHFIVRAGVGWDFELGRGFRLAPEVNYDFVESGDNAVVIGLTAAYAF